MLKEKKSGKNRLSMDCSGEKGIASNNYEHSNTCMHVYIGGNLIDGLFLII